MVPGRGVPTGRVELGADNETLVEVELVAVELAPNNEVFVGVDLVGGGGPNGEVFVGVELGRPNNEVFVGLLKMMLATKDRDARQL